MRNAVFSRSNLFFFSILALVLLGVVMLSTASAVLAVSRTGDSYYYVKKQLLDGIMPGAILFCIFSFFPYYKLKKIAAPLMFASIGLLLLVMMPHFGITANGATRWLNLGLFSFQPSVIFKISFVVYLAALFESRRKRAASFLEGLVPFLALLGVVALLLAAQPDLGTSFGICSFSYYGVRI